MDTDICPSGIDIPLYFSTRVDILDDRVHLVVACGCAKYSILLDMQLP
ncbi:hypothetical protein JXA70_08665 [candidate division KSB1 bacterium]|nr:hypothetical protein [candidate division KSB1 bacterium]